MRVSWQLLATLLMPLMAACDSESGESGLDEPLQVSGGAFRHGALPGAAPRSDGDDTDSLRLTTIETNNTVIHPGQAGKRISGRVTDDGYSVALRLEGLGSGYWIKTLGEEDSAYPGELEFGVALELAGDLPLGPRRLLFSVIDAEGHAGRQQALPLCVTSQYDRALNACDDTQQPPAAIISLTWDSSADLDLVVRTPDGDVVDARHPGTQTDPEQQGVLYTDDAACAQSSARREDLVWQREVPSGRYEVSVNAFNACGAAATFFRVSASRRVERDDGTYGFEPLGDYALGQLLEVQANGGQGEGLAVTSFEFP